jgi:hypothetical protein
MFGLIVASAGWVGAGLRGLRESETGNYSGGSEQYEKVATPCPETCC